MTLQPVLKLTSLCLFLHSTECNVQSRWTTLSDTIARANRDAASAPAQRQAPAIAVTVPVPTIPSQWESKIAVSGNAGFGGTVEEILMYSDGENKVSASLISLPISYLPGYVLNETVLQGPTMNDSFIVLNDVCRPYPTVYGDMFSFLTSSITHYLGKKDITLFNTTKSKECDTWYLSTKGIPGVAVETNLTLYTTGNVPVSFVVSTNSSGGGLPGMNNTHDGITETVQDFLTFIPGPQVSPMFNIPASCREPSVRCKKGSDFVQTIEMVVAQPAYSISKYDITNQDTGR